MPSPSIQQPPTPTVHIPYDKRAYTLRTIFSTRGLGVFNIGGKGIHASRRCFGHPLRGPAFGRWDTFRSGGKGGQNVNKVETGWFSNCVPQCPLHAPAMASHPASPSVTLSSSGESTRETLPKRSLIISQFRQVSG